MRPRKIFRLYRLYRNLRVVIALIFSSKIDISKESTLYLNNIIDENLRKDLLEARKARFSYSS